MTEKRQTPRRRFLKQATALGAMGLAAPLPRSLFAQDFPERTIQVYIPTRAGGGADRNFRDFAGVWKNHVGGEFEPLFFPGAAGRVGYETYMGKAADDCHDLIFGNMGPEVLNWVVKEPTFSLDDYFYFLQVDADPGCIFLSDESPMKTVDDVIAEGKKRTLTVATSRLAHPASLGMLVLAAKTGMSVNLIPLSGGRNTRNGVLTGETDIGVLPASSAARGGLSIVGLFDDKNVAPEMMPDAILLNTEYDLGIPPLPAGARAFGIKTAAAEKHPDRFEKLIESSRQVFTDPAYKQAILDSNAPWEMITPDHYRDQCKAYVDNVMALGREYKDLLTG
ncbi:MAG: tripartite tricarboxylate transporter substrate-binding protein [Gammaproteobacteria bacterium]|nr:tripartite tricarboxylate transporter substrate-binding protein [Gammaproteobacteria bacterium]